jgi:hypothetical protein
MLAEVQRCIQNADRVLLVKKYWSRRALNSYRGAAGVNFGAGRLLQFAIPLVIYLLFLFYTYVRRLRYVGLYSLGLA